MTIISAGSASCHFNKIILPLVCNMDSLQHTRSNQLSPLSQEHHDGMLFINRIREGLCRVSIDRLNRYTRWYWKNHIRPHFYHEENILLSYMPADHPLAVKLLEDHTYIRDLILSLDHEADEQYFKALCDLIDTHIRFEEQEVFTYLEQRLSQQELNKIYAQLADRPLAAEEWTDSFWIR